MTTDTVYGQPVGKKNHYSAAVTTDGKAYIYKDATLRAYEESFASQCTNYKDKMIDTSFTLFAKIFTDNPRCDIDNIITSVLDSLQVAKAITDDNLCIKVVAEKLIDRRNPRVQFAIQPIEGSLFVYVALECVRKTFRA